ncbi:hypothetical protein BRC94_02315 [Halobacteriales archaeon QS_5_70_17]|nr:MAG: hypothetical protein BRC94_02315 [Halobacteriales archaeon QS_5_70_17]
MGPGTKASLLWGAIGALAFLALAQGYNLLGPGGITAGAMVGVAAAVGAVAAAATYLVEGVL